MSLEISAPTAGIDAGTPAPAAPAPAAPAPAPVERTYTRSDVEAETNRVVQERLAREQRKYERQMAEMRQQYERPQTQEAVDPARAELDAYLKRQMDAYTAPIRQQMTEASLDRALSDLGKRYPDIGNEKTQREVLEIVVDRGLDRATHLSIPDVLDLAYRYWKVDHTPAPPAPVDVEGIKKQARDEAIKEYLATKTATSGSTPTPEGVGGATPVASAKPKGWRSADQAAMEIIKKSKAT